MLFQNYPLGLGLKFWHSNVSMGINMGPEQRLAWSLNTYRDDTWKKMRVSAGIDAVILLLGGCHLTFYKGWLH